MSPPFNSRRKWNYSLSPSPSKTQNHPEGWLCLGGDGGSWTRVRIRVRLWVYSAKFVLLIWSYLLENKQNTSSSSRVKSRVITTTHEDSQSRVYSTQLDVWDVYPVSITPACVWLRESGSESKRVSVRTWYCFFCKYKVEPFNELITSFDTAHNRHD